MKQWLIRLVGYAPAEACTGERADQPDAQFESCWRPSMKSRALLVLGLIGAWGLVVEARLVWLQVVHHERYAAAVEKQSSRVIPIEAERGGILDRNGVLLATSVEAFEVGVDPSESKDPEAEARLVCGALADCTASDLRDVAAMLRKTEDNNRPNRYELVRKAGTVSPDAAARLAALKGDPHRVTSLVLTARPQRFYPKRELAAHVLGYVGADNKGLGGVEAKFNADILGGKGQLVVLMDGKREIATRIEDAPTAGATLELTIDATLQYYAERYLHEAVQTYRAAGGSAIVMNPNTGELLAFANEPTFNPNDWSGVPQDWLRNRGVQEIYEPGSTFKIITAAAAIEEGLYAPSDLIDTNPGWIAFGRRVIPEAQGHNYGVLTFEDMLIRSSNVGAIKAGLLIGRDRMGQYAQRFGMGQRLSPHFAGESPGRFYPFAQLDDSGLASVSMGYQIGVTPLQMAAVCSVVANGGLLVEPHLVRAFVRDGHREIVEPVILRRVLREDTARTLRTIMEGVTQRGTGMPAALGRYLVAGKTGTAQKVVNKAYSETDYIVSFAGFVPSRQPAFTILVVIDTPRGVPAYGGTIAGPVFRKIAEAALRHAAVPASINPLPAVIMAGQRKPVLPPAVSVAVVPTSVSSGGPPVMPDLRGLGLREALRVASAAGVAVNAAGDGVVVSQWPAAGTPLDGPASGHLQLRRSPAEAPGGGR